ncbi:hypothetical protein K438DRAFT_1761774 [Mycena galopus ATCC 62051]|nr:hypothetical protein K438DRAFT_1761774 [Mycena galopus ATCC 62051]
MADGGLDSRTLNNYIFGGAGGSGGESHEQGIGGPGGIGQGPVVHQHYIVQGNFTVNNVHTRIFQGRRDILDQMHQFFSADVDGQHIFVLHGLGGAGKTQIALKFISKSSLRFSEIFFIDACSTETIQTGLKSIATAKNLGNSSEDALTWLKSDVEEWLVFFDNADDPNLNLHQYLPECDHGNVIITTRNPGLCVYSGSHSAVGDMNEDDAVALLLKSAVQRDSTSNQQLACQIVKALGYLPLAIIQAGAFISKSGALHSYLDLYMTNQQKLLSEKPTQSHDHYAWTVYTTWQMSFDQLSPTAAILLQLCSFLHYRGISQEIFSNASMYKFPSLGPCKEELQQPLEFVSHFLTPSGAWDALKFQDVTNEIRAYSLMDYDSETRTFSIHLLVQAWSKAMLAHQRLYHSTMAAIVGMSVDAITQEDIELSSLKLLPHLESLQCGEMQWTADFGEAYWRIYLHSGKAQQAEHIAAHMLVKRKQALGDDNPYTLLAMANLASTYYKLGEFKKAEELEVVVLAKRKQVHGENDQSTVNAMGNLASTYSELGELQKAKELMVVVLEKQRQLLGDSHQRTLTTMGNLAGTYLRMKDFTKAEEIQVVALQKQRQYQGEDHPDTLRTMANLACTYSDWGDLQKAEELEVIVLEKRKQLLGDNHPHTLLAMSNLVSTYLRFGGVSEVQRAEGLAIAVLKHQKHTLGDHHPDTVHAMVNLASIYSKLSQFQKAKELEEIVLKKQRQLLGDHHPSTLHTLGNLARTYSDLEEFHKAEELEKIVLNKRMQLLGNDHPDTLLAMANLASTYSDLCRFPEAQQLQVVVLEKREQFLGGHHPSTLRTMEILAYIYRCQDKVKQAEELEKRIKSM